MGAKVVVIGIDALDAERLGMYEERLPTFRRLRLECPRVNLASVYPPDSDTAWASIYTGLSPARHGIVHFVDPLEKTARYVSSDIDNSALRGRTFWDLASGAGKRVCVLFPHLGFPAWQVNGVMVGRSSIRDAIHAYPHRLAERNDLSAMNVVRGMPGRDRRAYIEASRRLVERQAAFAVEMLARETWDLFFVYSSVLDMIQHYFWNLCDADDPTFPGPNAYQDTISEFYGLHDEMVGRIQSAAMDAHTTVVLSDHGHEMRPSTVVDVNEYLRRKGLLAYRDGGLSATASRTVEGSKHLALEWIGRLGMGTLASRLLRLFPWIRRLYSRPTSVDWERTRAFSTNLSSFKAYSYGGVVLRRELLGETYEAAREEIMRDLDALRDPEWNKPVVKWVDRREALYEGPHIDKYPDIVFEFRRGFGAGATRNGKLFGESPSHLLVPGSHSASNAVFLISSMRKRAVSEHMSLMDVAPTILCSLGIDVPGGMDGRALQAL